MRQTYRAHWAHAVLACVLLGAAVLTPVLSSRFENLDRQSLTLVYGSTVVFLVMAAWASRWCFFKIEVRPEGLSVSRFQKREFFDWEDLIEVQVSTRHVDRNPLVRGSQAYTLYSYRVRTNDRRSLRFDSKQIEDARGLAEVLERRIEVRTREAET